MAFVLPDPRELAAMPWHKRDKVIARIRAYEREVGLYLTPTPPSVRYARTPECIAEYEAEWGESVRAEARRLAGECA